LLHGGSNNRSAGDAGGGVLAQTGSKTEEIVKVKI
jgi:hypothetical protein